MAEERKVTTRFEMTRVENLRPARPVDGVGLFAVADPAGADLDHIRALHDWLAAAHRWSSLGWSRAQWRRWVQTPSLRHWYVQRYGVDIGWGCLRRHGRHETELDSFGLVPDAIGQGCGGHALTLFARRAWDDMGPGGLLWLTTTSWDHPHAAANYAARGFAGRGAARPWGIARRGC